MLKHQSWSLRSLPSAASLCTEPGNSKKGTTKDKGENMISTIPEEIVKLPDEDLKKFWASKTLVTFPQRPAFPPRERDPGFSSAGGSNEKSDKESSSSSSSESDSSSDSDEEGDDIKDTRKTKVAFPRRDPILSEERTVKEKTANEQHFPQIRKKDSEKHLHNPTITVSPIKKKGVVFPRQDTISFKDRTVKVNTSRQHIPSSQNARALRDSPRISEPPIKEKEVCQTTDKLLQSELVKHDTKQKSKGAHLKSMDLVINPVEIQTSESQRLTSNQLETSLHEAASSKLSKTQQESMTTQNLTLLSQKESEARKGQDTASQERHAMKVQEELLDDNAPVVETTMMEEIAQETGIQEEEPSIAQEVKTEVETSQEAIDTSTYKNLQHHEYTPFTFVDYDVELSKFRLPQPSSGRASPWH
ncbi:NADH dehydrogenase [ubiquinone] flavoprotein 3, mitochondrial isoform X2 [Sphaerodactylus townsendi]|nr:NADH dehydrogenase [ubiquinone] flavoprotein 3, mitochondrial isoform X2 [Sphaerodactylus townsendi]